MIAHSQPRSGRCPRLGGASLPSGGEIVLGQARGTGDEFRNDQAKVLRKVFQMLRLRARAAPRRLKNNSDLSSEVGSFRADPIEEADWHKRGTRAHANCIENLPVFGAIVMALHVGHITGFWVDAFSVAILVGRILQSTVHICFVQTNTAVSFRFSFLCVQLVGFVGLIWIIVTRLSGSS